MNQEETRQRHGQEKYTGSSLKSNILLEALNDNGLKQLITEPTRSTETCKNILDLLITNVPNSLTNIMVVPGISDHDGITAHLSTHIAQPSLPCTRRLLYHKTDFESINICLKENINLLLMRLLIQTNSGSS